MGGDGRSCLYPRSRTGGSYRGSYSARTLNRWAESIAAWVAQRRNVFVYFDNDQKAAAPSDARRLISLLQASASAIRNL